MIKASLVLHFNVSVITSVILLHCLIIILINDEWFRIKTCERGWTACYARWFVVLNELCSNFITISLNVIPQTWFPSNFLSNVNLFSLNLDVDVEGAGRRLVCHWTACPGWEAYIRRYTYIRPSLTLISQVFGKEKTNLERLKSRNLKTTLFLPRVISPSSCLAQLGSASTYLVQYSWWYLPPASMNMLQNIIYKETAPEPVDIGLGLGEHHIDRGGSNWQGFCHVRGTPANRL